MAAAYEKYGIALSNIKISWRGISEDQRRRRIWRVASRRKQRRGESGGKGGIRNNSSKMNGEISQMAMVSAIKRKAARRRAIS